jgi:hypothetical protein
VSRRQTGVFRLAAFATGLAILWLLNAWFDPVPVAAGPAFLFAASLLLWKDWPGPRRPSLAAGIGAATGVLVHASWHWQGQSPAPAGGITVHLLWEGALGFAAAMVALLPFWLLSGLARGND